MSSLIEIANGIDPSLIKWHAIILFRLESRCFGWIVTFVMKVQCLDAWLSFFSLIAQFSRRKYRPRFGTKKKKTVLLIRHKSKQQSPMCPIHIAVTMTKNKSGTMIRPLCCIFIFLYWCVVECAKHVPHRLVDVYLHRKPNHVQTLDIDIRVRTACRAQLCAIE